MGKMIMSNDMGALEYRSAATSDVRFKDRIITVIAAPYEQPAIIEFRGGVWKELFERSAFHGLDQAPHRVRANREHNSNRTLGKVDRFVNLPEALVAEVRVAKTLLGDETLALADDDCLSASVCFAVPNGGQKLDLATRTRRVTRAFMQHLAFVEDPAYKGAQVLSVRNSSTPDTGDKLLTPNLDEAIAEMAEIREWTHKHLKLNS